MHQRIEVMQAIKQVGAADARRAHARKADEFLAFMRQQKEICWDELVAEFRRNYYDAFDEIVPPLFANDDAAVVNNVLAAFDPSKPKEMELVKRFVRECDPEKHQVSLRMLAEKKIPEVDKALKKRAKELPDWVREALA